MPPYTELSRLVALLIAVLALAACPGPGLEPAPAFAVNGLAVVVATDAPFAQRPDLPARIETTVAAALGYWGGDWSQLRGATLTLSGAAGVPCGAGTALGCFDGDIRVSTRDPGAGTITCVEATVLVHEVAHAVIGDAGHTDPRWMQMDELSAALSGRAGYGADGPAPCEAALSVWRHTLSPQ